LNEPAKPFKEEKPADKQQPEPPKKKKNIFQRIFGSKDKKNE
jgi:hypothetical protein